MSTSGAEPSGPEHDTPNTSADPSESAPADTAVADSDGQIVGRRGLVGAMFGAVAVGAVMGAGATQFLDEDEDPPATAGDGPDPDAAETVPDPPPADPDSPPIEIEAASSSTTREARSTDPAPYDPTSPLNPLHDLRVAHQLIDDFPPVAPDSGRVGSAGWAVVSGGAGARAAAADEMDGGVVHLSTGSASTGRVGLHLGLRSMTGLPVFTMEWRLSFAPLDNGRQTGGTVFGCLDAVDKGGTAPGRGVYFLYRPDLSANWLCACASSEGRTVTDTGLAVAEGFHRFQVTSDGTSLCRFYVDDHRVASIDSHAPLADDRYGVGIEVFKTAGADPQGLDLDWFFLRRELAR